MSYFSPDVIAWKQLPGASGVQPPIVYTSYGLPFLYTSANWGAVSFYLEVYIRATTGIAYACLYNETDSVKVTDSEVFTTNVAFQRLRSSALTLTDGKVYRVRFGAVAGHAGKFLGGKLVVTD